MKLIFKHSTRCPISARAKQEVDAFLNEFGNHVEFMYVDVIGNRDLSNQIAAKYGIRHESPQAIFVDENDQVIWHDSHFQITKSQLEAVLKKYFKPSEKENEL